MNTKHPGKTKDESRRKIEYHRKEAESSELVVNTMGAYIGVSDGYLTIRVQKKPVGKHRLASLRHITLLSHGISLSSNAVDQCVERKIPIDFFDSHGKHKATILSPRTIDSDCWAAQASLPDPDRFILAKKILFGKVRNQVNLIKYFHKYHSKAMPQLAQAGLDAINQLTLLSLKIKDSPFSSPYRETLMALEAQAAVVYWAYVRTLLADDKIEFLQRQHQGATDLFNAMLNYGYALLYARVWQAVLAARLNPADSVLHVRQPGKPTLVFDIVEIFRAQSVDRIVIAMVQKHLPLAIEDGRLSHDTRATLAAAILERLNRYEKFRGEEIRFEQIIQKQTAEIALFITQHKTFRPYLAKW